MEADAGGRKLSFGTKIAETEGITRSFVNRLLRLTLLAPHIVEAILDGRQPKPVQLDELARTMPSGWESRDNPSVIVLLESNGTNIVNIVTYRCENIIKLTTHPMVA